MQFEAGEDEGPALSAYSFVCLAVIESVGFRGLSRTEWSRL